MAKRFEESKGALSDLVKELDKRGLRTSAVYVEKLSGSIFTYVKLLLSSGEQVSRTTGYTVQGSRNKQGPQISLNLWNTNDTNKQIYTNR